MGSNQLAQLVKTDQGFSVHGSLNFQNISSLYRDGATLLRASVVARKSCMIDLAKVHENSAASLALMLAWLRLAKELHLAVVFTQLTASMNRMIEVFELTHVLPIEQIEQ